MKFKLAIDEHHNFVRAEIAGQCSFIDFGRFFVRLLDLKAEPGLKILTDIREAELSEGDFNGVSTVESRADQFIDAYLPVRQAILVNGQLNFGIARMYEALAEKDGYEVHIFRDEEAAKEWLCTAASLVQPTPQHRT